MLPAASVDRLHVLLERADFFVSEKEVSKPLSARLIGRAFFCRGCGGSIPVDSRGRCCQRSTTPATIAAAFTRTSGARCFQFAGGYGPVFHDVVPCIHRGGQQILPMIPVPERVDVEQWCRAMLCVRALRACRERQNPGEALQDLETCDSHDKSPLQPSVLYSRPLQVWATRTTTYTSCCMVGTNFPNKNRISLLKGNIDKHYSFHYQRTRKA
jgi:hypothetical protein